VKWEKIARKKNVDKAAESSQTGIKHLKKQVLLDWKVRTSPDGDRDKPHKQMTPGALHRGVLSTLSRNNMMDILQLFNFYLQNFPCLIAVNF
jgi:hypothetical protein